MTKKTEGTKIWQFAYNLLGNKLERVFPKFQDIRKNLHRALFKVSYRAYVSFMVFISILAFLVTSACSSVILLLFNAIGIIHMNAFSFLLSSLGPSGLVALVTFMVAYMYPSMKANSRKGKLESELPYASSYMSILSSAGSSPYKIFHSLSVTKTLPAFTGDAQVVLRDTNLLGEDMFTSLKNAAERSPSQRYGLFLEGLIATIRSGGDLTKYLNEESIELMRIRTIEVRKFLDSLGLIAESYITMLVAFPLMLVIMLGVMSTIGGSFGGISITTILYLLTYLAIPGLACIVIILVDAMSPD
jgi:flagellar protein FlaJ